ncbi:MAG: TauD/TfdA family dioxygenase [Alphaproteobacteria bacterium]|jgi:taurine dioxygenase|nr:TauD/TfdA family dioxygenase [Alphaproteobacteria bacterium]
MSEFGKIFEGEARADLLQPNGGAALNEALLEAGVLCLRGAALSGGDFLALARRLGEPQAQLIREHRDDEYPDVSIISNAHVDALGDGKRIVLGRHWHTDDSYFAVPSAVTLLHANCVPAGKGDTLFADTRAAFDELPELNKNIINGRQAIHKYKSRRNVSPVPHRTAEEEAETPPVSHPLVRTHPETGRRALYLNPNRIDHVAGLSLEDGDALLDELLAFATRSEFVYRHRWQAGDVVIWDNRCTMHRVEDDFGSAPREMMRVLLKGAVPV